MGVAIKNNIKKFFLSFSVNLIHVQFVTEVQQRLMKVQCDARRLDERCRRLL